MRICVFSPRKRGYVKSVSVLLKYVRAGERQLELQYLLETYGVNDTCVGMATTFVVCALVVYPSTIHDLIFILHH